MNQTIFSLLSRRPDEIIGENVFFHTSFDERLQDWTSPALDSNNEPLLRGVEGYHKFYNETITEEFSGFHQNGYLVAEKLRSDFPWAQDPQLHRVLTEIAYSGKPVLDVASDFYMGLLPFVLKYNPSARVCASDINVQGMKTLSNCLREHLPSYNVNVTSFDNNNIPFRDNSLDYVTSIDGMTSSAGSRKGPLIAARCLGQEQAVSEVYRILKPGGYFVTVEQFIDCDFDLREIFEYCETYGKIYGIFSFEEIKDFLNWICQASWTTTFTSAGFTVETENEYSHRLTVGELKKLLIRYTDHMGVHTWTEADIARLYLSKELYHAAAEADSPESVSKSKAFQKEWVKVGRIYVKSKMYTREDISEILWKCVKHREVSEPCELPEDFGLDVYDGDTVYVLKK